MDDLRKASRAAAKKAVADAALEDAIREVYAQGTSLRKIAEVVGMSHTQVARIVKREN